MATSTPNLNLHVVPQSSTDKTFLDWRKEMADDTANSNMMIIDDAVGDLQTDVAAKADKVSSATAGNFAGLDTNGNLTDSGAEAGDFAPEINGLTDEAALADSDAFIFYDASATAHRKTLWSNIKSKLKTYFDTLYNYFSGSYDDLADVPESFPPSAHTHTPAEAGADAAGTAGTAVNAHNSSGAAHALLFDAKAPLDSPALTGTPTAPTALASVDTTQLATCEFVHDAVAADVQADGATTAAVEAILTANEFEV